MSTTKTKVGKKPVKSPAVTNGMPEPADVLTLAEAAAYLRVAETDLMNAAIAGELPGRQIGREWRFSKSSLQDWLNTPAPKTGNEAFLALWGCWKDDPDAEEMLKEIYKKRGRPMTEDGE